MEIDREKKKGLLLIGAAALAGIVLLAVALWPQRREAPAAGASSTGFVDIPDAEQETMAESKTDAYRTGDSGRSSRESNVERMWDDLETIGTTGDGNRDGDAEQEQQEDGSRYPGGRKPSVDDFVPPVQPSAPAPDYTAGSGREEAQRRIREAEARRDAALAAAAGQQQGQQQAVQEPEPEPEQRIGTPAPKAVRKTGAVSSLDGWDGDTGMGSLDSDDSCVTADADYPFRCMFVRQTKVRNGQRVAVRLLEDMVIGSKLIPRNTHLMAQASIGDRLELAVTNIELHGQIYSLDYEAYDTDGAKGIYCPDLSARERQQVQQQGMTTVRGIFSSRVARIASDIVNTGIQVAQSASGEVTVTVPEGYTFFIVQKKK